MKLILGLKPHVIHHHFYYAVSRMPPRRDCTQVEIQGAYPGADVVRGKDWNLEDKDGDV